MYLGLTPSTSATATIPVMRSLDPSTGERKPGRIPARVSTSATVKAEKQRLRRYGIEVSLLNQQKGNQRHQQGHGSSRADDAANPGLPIRQGAQKVIRTRQRGVSQQDGYKRNIRR